MEPVRCSLRQGNFPLKKFLFIKSDLALVIMILAHYHCIESSGNLIRGRYNSLQMAALGLLPPEIYAESRLDAFHRVGA